MALDHKPLVSNLQECSTSTPHEALLESELNPVGSCHHSSYREEITEQDLGLSHVSLTLIPI